jgi:phosphoserine phosphatase RsbU/P
MACTDVLRTRGRAGGLTRAAHVHLQPDLISVAEARRFVQTQLAGLPDSTVNDASLLVSELATNAIIHVDTPLVVGVAGDDDEVLIAVTDERHDRVPVLGRMPTAEDVAEMSRGIAIVRSIARDFGWHLLHDSPGKVVWFTLDPLGAKQG